MATTTTEGAKEGLQPGQFLIESNSLRTKSESKIRVPSFERYLPVVVAAAAAVGAKKIMVKGVNQIWRGKKSRSLRSKYYY